MEQSYLLKCCYTRFTHADAWRYQEPKEIEGVDYWGKFAVYGGGGAVQTLDTRKNTSRAILRELREGLWIDRATRLIIVDFTIYNANINMFCIVKLAFEIPPTGGLSTSTRFRTVKVSKEIRRKYCQIVCYYYPAAKICECLGLHNAGCGSSFWLLHSLLCGGGSARNKVHT